MFAMFERVFKSGMFAMFRNVRKASARRARARLAPSSRCELRQLEG
jgi:hypothetical protein